jgi:hypothetical protein
LPPPSSGGGDDGGGGGGGDGSGDGEHEVICQNLRATKPAMCPNPFLLAQAMRKISCLELASTENPLC